MRPPREIRALAVDYDRTLTDPALRIVPRALDALRRARRAGRKVVVVSGRDRAFLERELGDVADAIVSENGCFLLHDGRAQRLGPAVDLAALDDLDIAIERGDALASVDLADEARVRDALRGGPVHFVRNRDRVMVLPRGVDKATGMIAALAALGVRPEETAAAGDGENDVVMLAAAGYAIAVANAVAGLKAVADHVTAEEGGLGLAAWIERVWLPALEARA